MLLKLLTIAREVFLLILHRLLLLLAGQLRHLRLRGPPLALCCLQSAIGLCQCLHRRMLHDQMTK